MNKEETGRELDANGAPEGRAPEEETEALGEMPKTVGATEAPETVGEGEARTVEAGEGKAGAAEGSEDGGEDGSWFKKGKPTKTYYKGDASFRRNRKYMTFYIVALFGVALMIVFLSYLNQVKADQAIENMDIQTTEAKNKIDQLQAQFDAMLARVDQTEKELNKTKAALDEEKAVAEQQRMTIEEKDRLIAALNLLWQIEKEFEAEREAECKALVDQMQREFSGVLPTEAQAEYVRIRAVLGYED